MTVPVVVRQAPTVVQGSVHCGDEPNDCVVVDWAGYDGGFSVPDPAKVSVAPIDVSPTDMLVVTPHLGLPVAGTVVVTGAHFRAGPVARAAVHQRLGRGARHGDRRLGVWPGDDGGRGG